MQYFLLHDKGKPLNKTDFELNTELAFTCLKFVVCYAVNCDVIGDFFLNVSL